MVLKHLICHEVLCSHKIWHVIPMFIAGRSRAAWGRKGRLGKGVGKTSPRRVIRPPPPRCVSSDENTNTNTQNMHGWEALMPDGFLSAASILYREPHLLNPFALGMRTDICGSGVLGQDPQIPGMTQSAQSSQFHILSTTCRLVWCVFYLSALPLYLYTWRMIWKNNFLEK